MKGFVVQINLHTNDSRNFLNHPEKVREIVGIALDRQGLLEEIDYTLVVERMYGNG